MNEENNNTAGELISKSVTGSLLMAALGYFVYSGLDGAFGMIVFGSILGLSLLIAIIPYGIGFIAQVCILFFWLIPLLFEFTGLYHTWLTWIEVISVLILGIIINLLTTLSVSER
jgi:hypothetical protein